MNSNDDIITAVREQRDRVPMTVPAEQIINRGRTLRARRRIPGVAGGLAVLAAAALTVTALLPSGRPAPAQLAAWTVSKVSSGSIHVTIRELRDPAGLQARLRAEGLPINVSFSGPPLSSVCQPLNVSKPVLLPVAHVQGHGGSAELVFHVSAIPSRDGVSLFINSKPPAAHVRTEGGPPHAPVLSVAIAVGLVHASPQCTG
jgi:hypothetical protein